MMTERLRILWIVVPIIGVLVGVVGNTLTLFTVANKHCKKSAFTTYLAALAIADAVILTIGCLEGFFFYGLHIDLMAQSLIYCKLCSFLTLTFEMISSCFLAALTVDRMLLVYLPYNDMIGKPKAALIVIACIVGFLFAINGHLLYGFTLVTGQNNTSLITGHNNTFLISGQNTSLIAEQNSTTMTLVTSNVNTTLVIDQRDMMCDFIDATYEDFFTRYYTVVQCLLYYFLPVLLIAGCNTATVVKVTKQGLGAADKRQRKNRRLVKLVVTVSVMFIVLATPKAVYFIIRPILFEEMNEFYFYNDTDFIMYTVANFLGYINFGCNFFLYVVTAPQFRQDLKNAVCRKRD